MTNDEGIRAVCLRSLEAAGSFAASRQLLPADQAAPHCLGLGAAADTWLGTAAPLPRARRFVLAAEEYRPEADHRFAVEVAAPDFGEPNRHPARKTCRDADENP